MKQLPNRLKNEKPGLTAQLRLAPQPWLSTVTYQEALAQCLKAAVLLLLYSKEDELLLVFIRRTGFGRYHQNQISFPGGQQNVNESIEQTALRETTEELGISPIDLIMLGRLTPLYVHSSNYCIFPVVAATRSQPVFKPCLTEVAEIIEVPLAHLIDSQNLKQETWELRGRKTQVPFYQYQEYKIWGATAMILSEFLEILAKLLDL
ncbi:MAG: NUDIX hydrolase [Candidatus Saccharicenans sp.]